MLGDKYYSKSTILFLNFNTILVRKKNKQIVDQCIPLTDLRNKVKNLCSYVMDKQKKNRYAEIKKICESVFHCECVQLELPNVTRVAGFYRMIQSCIRNKYLIEALKTRGQKLLPEICNLSLTDSEWIDVVEIESILKEVTILNMNLQSDNPGRQALTCYEILKTKQILFQEKPEFEVVDLSDPWNPDVSFDNLPRTSYNTDRMGNIALTFLSRLKKEVETYLSHIDSDMKAACLLNPVTAQLSML